MDSPRRSRTFRRSLLVVGCLMVLLALLAPSIGAYSGAGPARLVIGPRAGAIESGALSPSNVSCPPIWAISVALTTPYTIVFGPNGNTTAIGPAPIQAVYNVSFPAGVASYNFTMQWGDNTSSSDAFTAPSNLSTVVGVNHTYALPGYYSNAFNVTQTCSGSLVQEQSYWMPPMLVFGPGGLHPVSVTANVTSATVPFALQYDATIVDPPANATASWVVFDANGSPLEWSQTAQNLTSSVLDVNVTSVGAIYGTLQVRYPDGILYDDVPLPNVQSNPQDFISLADTSASGSSPWNYTFWGNVTTLTGGAYAGNATVEWTFLQPGDNFSGLTATGPTIGSPVWQAFDWTLPYGIVHTVEVRLVDAQGDTIAGNTSWIFLQGASVPPPLLSLSVDPSNGTAPFRFNATAQSGLGSISNGELQFQALWSTPGGPGANNSSAVWWDNVTSWHGANATVAGELLDPGTYLFTVQATEESFNASLNTTIVSGIGFAWFAVVVFAPVVSGGGPFLSVNATPAAGPATLNVSLGLLASGGSPNYALSVCTEGPFTSPNGTGPCTTAGGQSGWNGLALTIPLSFDAVGNYTIVATINDSNAQSASASTEVVVQPAPVAAPLIVQASYVPPGAVTAAGASYGFVTTIQGGTAPYDVQWTFGDGSSGSATPGSTVTHTYTSTGTYTATLKVTDARGVTSSAHVGPLEVVVPTGGAALTAWWASNWALGGTLVIAVAALIALGGLVLWAARRREALNWVEHLESGDEAEAPAPRLR